MPTQRPLGTVSEVHDFPAVKPCLLPYKDIESDFLLACPNNKIIILSQEIPAHENVLTGAEKAGVSVTEITTTEGERSPVS